jgi:quercetin dioxygenase-like cupin family protein
VPFAGHTGPRIQSTCLELSESTYDGGLEQPMHGHHPAYFTAVLSGEYEERTGRATRLVRAGALLFHTPDEEHAVRFRAAHTRVFRILPLEPMLEAEEAGENEASRPRSRALKRVRTTSLRGCGHSTSRRTRSRRWRSTGSPAS